MVFTVPFVSSTMSIEPQWIDYNGHFNMAYYNVLFDRAADEFLEKLGLGAAYVKTTGGSIFTLETHTTYVRELKASDKVVIEIQILDHDHKRIHYVQRMLHAGERWLACVLEVMLSHVDLAAKKTSSFPAEILAKIARIDAAHKTLPVPAQVGHRIGIPRK